MSDTRVFLTIDGVGPMPIERPATVADVCDVVRRCAADGTAIYPVGGGTLLDYGTPPARPGIALSTTKLDQVIDFPARDMTITVQAGITMARLHEITTAERLWLPIDVPDPATATLGGSIAANVSGPRRYGYGTFRDYVIGVTLVNDRGEETKAGGRVVKNVAGYDLMKLYTGSLGTLGVITQVTLKLKPLPEEVGAVWITLTGEQLADGFNRLHRTETRPAWIFSDNCPVPGDDQKRPLAEARWHWPTTIGFEGNAEAVDWQVRRLQDEMKSLAPPGLGGDIGADVRYLLPEIPPRDTTSVVCRLSANLRPGTVAEFCLLASAVGEQVVIIALPGSGVVYVEFRGVESWPLTEVRRSFDSLLKYATAHEGNVIVRYCATEWKKSLPVWGRPPTDLALQKAVKRELDPKGILNPGRFVTDAH